VSLHVSGIREVWPLLVYVRGAPAFRFRSAIMSFAPA
jgi:hypothetical protein